MSPTSASGGITSQNRRRAYTRRAHVSRFVETPIERFCLRQNLSIGVSTKHWMYFVYVKLVFPPSFRYVKIIVRDVVRCKKEDRAIVGYGD